MDATPQAVKTAGGSFEYKDDVAVKRNSYAYLIPVAIGLLLFTALILALIFIVWPSVHFKPMAEKTCLISSLVLTIALLLRTWLTRKAEFLRHKPLDRLKAILGLLLGSAMVMAALLSVVILLTSTVPSSYVASYEYSPGGHRSCSGIQVFDPEVNKQIKICHASHYGDQGWARVEKRSGPLGIVVRNAVRL